MLLFEIVESLKQNATTVTVEDGNGVSTTGIIVDYSTGTGDTAYLKIKVGAGANEVDHIVPFYRIVKFSYPNPTV